MRDFAYIFKPIKKKTKTTVCIKFISDPKLVTQDNQYHVYIDQLFVKVNVIYQVKWEKHNYLLFGVHHHLSANNINYFV